MEFKMQNASNAITCVTLDNEIVTRIVDAHPEVTNIFHSDLESFNGNIADSFSKSALLQVLDSKGLTKYFENTEWLQRHFSDLFIGRFRNFGEAGAYLYVTNDLYADCVPVKNDTLDFEGFFVKFVTNPGSCGCGSSQYDIIFDNDYEYFYVFCVEYYYDYNEICFGM